MVSTMVLVVVLCVRVHSLVDYVCVMHNCEGGDDGCSFILWLAQPRLEPPPNGASLELLHSMRAWLCGVVAFRVPARTRVPVRLSPPPDQYSIAWGHIHKFSLPSVVPVRPYLAVLG